MSLASRFSAVRGVVSSRLTKDPDYDAGEAEIDADWDQWDADLAPFNQPPVDDIPFVEPPEDMR